MNVYLLPHHRFDPRFRYTLERESSDVDAIRDTHHAAGVWHRSWHWLKLLYRRLKVDYDQVVHGHEQIRLSRLVLMMDRDPNLTLFVPAGMTQESALVAIQGVIRSGLMALRSHAIRNVITALVMMIVLFGAIPTHVAAVIFYPLIGLYAWGRYWEDRLIRRTMNHLLNVELSNGREHFREEPHLAYLEETFLKTARPEVAYFEAVRYLDGLNHRVDGIVSPQHAVMYKYYSDIGRLDPYERYQDRIRKKLIETAKLIGHHLWEFWNWAFHWSLSTTRILGLKLPNSVFVLLGAIVAVYSAIWIFSWRTATVETFPASVRAIVEFFGATRVVVDSRRDWSAKARREVPEPASPIQPNSFTIACPLDSAQIDLWPVVMEMIANREKRRKGNITCPCEASHAAAYEIRIKY